MDVGRVGEEIAKTYLLAQGYELLAQNWRCRLGELDLVMQRAGQLVFVEVKTRSGSDVNEAMLSMTTRKSERLTRAVYAYLEENHLPEDGWQLDLVAVAVPFRGDPVIVHTENCVDW